MLALLKQYKAHATFFNVGKSVSAWPDLVAPSPQPDTTSPIIRGIIRHWPA